MAKKYYAVKVGKTTGIYETWEECKANVDGFPGALYKSFKSLTDAYDYMGYTGTQLDIFSFANDNSNNSNISDISHSDSSVDASKTDTTDNAFEPDGPSITHIFPFSTSKLTSFITFILLLPTPKLFSKFFISRNIHPPCISIIYNTFMVLNFTLRVKFRAIFIFLFLKRKSN